MNEKEVLDRRMPVPKECLKLDTFASINQSLQKIETKLDDISEEMRTMVRLEERVINQNSELTRLNAIVDSLRLNNSELSARMLDLRSNFESQKKSIGTFERIVWAAATGIAIIAGKYMGVDL
jgi:uncharacterized coiled-coil protein SlyX